MLARKELGDGHLSVTLSLSVSLLHLEGLAREELGDTHAAQVREGLEAPLTEVGYHLAPCVCVCLCVCVSE